jgi:hypothetical protein
MLELEAPRAVGDAVVRHVAEHLPSATPHLAADEVGGRPACDGEHPQAHRRVAAEAGEAADRAQEGVLGGVERLLAVAEQRVAVPPDVVLQRAAHRLDRRVVAAGGPTRQDLEVLWTHATASPPRAHTGGVVRPTRAVPQHGGSGLVAGRGPWSAGRPPPRSAAAPPA